MHLYYQLCVNILYYDGVAKSGARLRSIRAPVIENISVI